MHLTTTENPKETKKIAGEVAKKLIGRKSGKSLVIALEGDLGVGKTTFIKGFSKTLGFREKVLSPTFVLIHKHKILMKQFKNLYHIDAYRLNSGKELVKLGIKEIFTDPENIVLIEWADRVKKIIPKNATWIHFKHSYKNRREIKIK